MSFKRDVTKSHTGARRRAPKGHKRQFTRTADSIHKINTASPARPMRGGIRL